MKILLPNFAHSWEDPYHKLFVAYMYRISQQHGFNYEYVMYPGDARIICQSYYRVPHYVFEPYDGWRHFRFYGLDQSNWCFRWKREPIASMHEWTDEKAKMLWSYLLGREAEDVIVEDWKGWHRGRVDQVLAKEDREWYRYYAKRKTNDDE